MKKTKILLLFIAISMISFSTVAQNWLSDMNEAKILAADGNKLIVLVFQGSDWCAPCIRFDKEIWSTDAFKNYAEENLILVKADFPRRKENRLSKEQTTKNEILADKYNEQGAFPLVVILDKDENVIRKDGYEKTTPEDYIAALQKLE